MHYISVSMSIPHSCLTFSRYVLFTFTWALLSADVVLISVSDTLYPPSFPTCTELSLWYYNVSPLIIVGKTYRTGIGVKKTTQSRKGIYYGVY